MFLTIHAASGILIGENVNSPVLSFVLSFLVHFIIDVIPHGDREIAELAMVESLPESETMKSFKRFVKISAIDFGLMFLLVLAGYGAGIFRNPLSVAFGIAGAITPDLITASYYVISKNYLLKVIEKVHNFFHYDLIKKDFSLKTGLVIQIIIGALLYGWAIMK